MPKLLNTFCFLFLVILVNTSFGQFLEIAKTEAHYGLLKQKFADNSLEWAGYHIETNLGAKIDSNWTAIGSLRFNSYHYWYISTPLSEQFRTNTLRLGIVWKKNPWTFTFLPHVMANIPLYDIKRKGLFFGFTSVLRYRHSAKFQTAYGIYITEFVPLRNILPLIGFRWKINDHWYADALLPYISRLEYRINPKHNLGVGHLSFLNPSYWGQGLRQSSYELRAFGFAEKKVVDKLWAYFQVGALVYPIYKMYDLQHQLNSPTTAFNRDYNTGLFLNFGLSYRLPFAI